MCCRKWLVESLVPDNIARQVLGLLNQFAGKASKLGVGGPCRCWLGSALALILTIDRTLNSIWRVRTRRPLGAAGADLLVCADAGSSGCWAPA